MSNRVLIIGANGMLGSSLFRYLSNQIGLAVIGSVRTHDAADVLQKQGFANLTVGTDVRDRDALKTLIEETNPTDVLNCVGVIKQLDQAKAPIPSIQINSLLPHQLAELCDNVGARLIHFSTDCVFSGNNGMYVEEDQSDAIDLYGKSKLLGEVDYGKHITLRTSIIGHEINSAISLVAWFLAQSGEVNGFSKAVFSGLPTVCVAEFLFEYILTNSDLSGLYHLSVDSINKFDLLKLIKSQYGVKTHINEYSDFQIDRSLDSTKLRNITNFEPTKWTELISKMHNEYKQYFS